MKTFFCLALTLVLTAALFTGCGCTNSNRPEMTTPTSLPTTAPTVPATRPATMPTAETTRPTTEATSGTVIPDETADGTVVTTLPESRRMERNK